MGDGGIMSDARKIGMGLTAFGVFFTALGIFMLFDQALLSMGNLMFIAGIVLTIGPSHVGAFFLQKHKLRGTGTFFVGMTMVLFGWPKLGICIEIFGFVNLFGNFFPVAMGFVKRVPYVGPLVEKGLNLIPGLKDYVLKKKAELGNSGLLGGAAGSTRKGGAARNL